MLSNLLSNSTCAATEWYDANHRVLPWRRNARSHFHPPPRTSLATPSEVAAADAAAHAAGANPEDDSVRAFWAGAAVGPSTYYSPRRGTPCNEG